MIFFKRLKQEEVNLLSEKSNVDFFIYSKSRNMITYRNIKDKKIKSYINNISIYKDDIKILLRKEIKTKLSIPSGILIQQNKEKFGIWSFYPCRNLSDIKNILSFHSNKVEHYIFSESLESIEYYKESKNKIRLNHFISCDGFNIKSLIQFYQIKLQPIETTREKSDSLNNVLNFIGKEINKGNLKEEKSYYFKFLDHFSPKTIYLKENILIDNKKPAVFYKRLTVKNNLFKILNHYKEKQVYFFDKDKKTEMEITTSIKGFSARRTKCNSYYTVYILDNKYEKLEHNKRLIYFDKENDKFIFVLKNV